MTTHEKSCNWEKSRRFRLNSNFFLFDSRHEIKFDCTKHLANKINHNEMCNQMIEHFLMNWDATLMMNFTLRDLRDHLLIFHAAHTASVHWEQKIFSTMEKEKKLSRLFPSLENLTKVGVKKWEWWAEQNRNKNSFFA